MRIRELFDAVNVEDHEKERKKREAAEKAKQ